MIIADLFLLKRSPYFLDSNFRLIHRRESSELMIKGSTEDNSKIIFLISQRKHML